MITPFASNLLQPRAENLCFYISAEREREHRKKTTYPAQPLPLPVPHTDAPIAGALELARWRHDFPPPQNIVAERLAAASLHQADDGSKKSLRWLPDEKKWERLEPHDTDWLLFYFLLCHDARRAGLWQHAKAQPTLSDLFHVRFPMAAPKTITSAHDIPTSTSSRDLSDLRADVPTCWNEPVKPFTARYVDWDGTLRKVRIKPEPSELKSVTPHVSEFSPYEYRRESGKTLVFAEDKWRETFITMEGEKAYFNEAAEEVPLGNTQQATIPPSAELVYTNPKFPAAEPTPICDDRKHYFAKERMQHEGVQFVQENRIIELVADALGGARFKPTDDPLEYLWSFAPDETHLHANAPDPRKLHDADKQKFAQQAAESERSRREYEQHAVQGFGKPTTEQKKLWNKLLVKHGLYGSELSGFKWQPPKHPSITCPAETEVRRTPFEEAMRDDVDADVSIFNHDDSGYLRSLAAYGEVFRQYYGDNPSPQQLPDLKRDLYLFETALSKEWKSDAERKEWQRRLDTMHYFIHGVCPTGTCGINNRCANPDLSPKERQATHAANLLQKVAPAEFAKLKVGTYYLVVVLQGQPRLKILKAKTAEQADGEIQRLVESSVKKARASARRQNKSEKDAEQRIRDAYRVADKWYLADEKYLLSQQRDAAD